MNKITIIQLLTKIAKGEELPKKIKYGNTEYSLQDNDYWSDRIRGYFSVEDLGLDNLTDELEILDEEDEFEDIEELYSCCMETKDLEKQVLRDNINTLSERINQLIKNQKKIIERLKDKE